MKLLFSLFILISAISYAQTTAPATSSAGPTATSDVGSKMGSQPQTTINSDVLEYDYEKRTGSFEGNVVAVDPQLTLKCKKMLVFFGEKNNEVLRVEAFGDVHLLQDDKEATGDKAIFTRETGIVIISGNAKLQDKKGNSFVNQGQGIIYNVHTKVMKADRGVTSIHSSTGEGLLSPNSK
jgi:lipopolysaccharide transport protein LptA